MSEFLGYARVSTAEQTAALQEDALRAAGCQRIWSDTASGTRTDRPQLVAVFDHLRAGDTLIVWRLDRLGRSLPHLIETIGELQARGVGFKSVQENIDTTTPGGRLVFHVFGALASFERAGHSCGAHSCARRVMRAATSWGSWPAPTARPAR